MEDTMPDLTARISHLSEHSTIHEVKEIVRDIFHVHFGMSSDVTRMNDITNEFHEFTRAISRMHRKEEFLRLEEISSRRAKNSSIPHSILMLFILFLLFPILWAGSLTW